MWILAPSVELRASTLVPPLTQLQRECSALGVHAYCQYLLCTICVSAGSPAILPGSSITLSRVNQTDNIVVLPDGLTVRNDAWTFESILADRPAPSSGRWMYEVCLASSGTMQIGWSMLSSRLDAQMGIGIGDTDQSYAFDGDRRYLWHGTAAPMSYDGERWASGTVIGCLLDMDNSTMRFAMNGKVVQDAQFTLTEKVRLDTFICNLALFCA